MKNDSVQTTSDKQLLDGRYRVTGKVGSGASAIVYRCEDVLVPGRIVAVKHYHHADPPVEEMQHLSKMTHAGVPRSHGMFYEDAAWHLVMDYIEASTLEETRRINGGKVGPTLVCDTGMQLASILDEAHSHGIIYRDLKPANVLVSWTWHISLVDFGGASHTTQNDFYVTPPYASPEQRVGQETIDSRSDIYALGALLYELLTGHCNFEMKPYKNTSMEHVRRICLAMLAHRPEKRPQSMLQVIRELLRARQAFT